MYQYEKHTPPPCTSQGLPEWRFQSEVEWCERSIERARRPLPLPPNVCSIPVKSGIPLKVWVIVALCFAVCALLVLATIVITRLDADYGRGQVFVQPPEHIYSQHHFENKLSKPMTRTPDLPPAETEDLETDLYDPILEKLSIFKNIVANRDKTKRTEKKPEVNLLAKPQFHPLHEEIEHEERKIEKKDQPKALKEDVAKSIDLKKSIPEFKPTLPDVMKMVDGYMAKSKMKKHELDYDDYYNDENLYDDYMQSNSMTNYLIEKIQELHDWITTDADFTAANKKLDRKPVKTEFSQLLKALNESLVEGNVTIVMSKLKDLYFGDNYTMGNNTKKVILTNSTDLLSFGILTLDIILLHNIQLTAWENQESARNKMLRDPDVFAFHALFLEPGRVEARYQEIHNHEGHSKRQNLRTESSDDYDFGKNLLENVLEVGMSTARAAIHLGRAYKNTKQVLNQLSSTNKESINANIQNQISRNNDGNTLALNHLQNTFNGSTVGNTTEVFTELDCVWLLYCKNLVATSKLKAPYGTMARINGMALKMLTGEVPADRALDSMLYEALTGWTELKCTDMFPRCSKADPAAVILDSILQPLRKSQATNRSQ